VAPPGAGCFASAEEVYDSDTDTLLAERTYGCLPADDDGGLFLCKVTEDGLRLFKKTVKGICHDILTAWKYVN
jgi:hypothetical protein